MKTAPHALRLDDFSLQSLGEAAYVKSVIEAVYQCFSFEDFDKSRGISSQLVRLLACSILTALIARLPYEFMLFTLAAVVVCYSRPSKKQPRSQERHPRHSACKRITESGSLKRQPQHSGCKRIAEPRSQERQPQHSECKSISEPPLAPVFQATHLNEQLQELVVKMRPKPADYEAVGSLVQSLRSAIRDALEFNMSISGFAYANAFVETALGKAEPEICMAVNINLAQYHAMHKQKKHWDTNFTMESVPKNIMRRIKKSLTSDHDFKLRRFVFTDNLRLVLNAPVQYASSKERVCMQISINSTLPLHGAKLMKFCKDVQPLAYDMVLLVQQWTRWRALCIVDSGDLHHYAWALLVVFYMQVTGNALPPFQEHTKGLVCTDSDPIPMSLSEVFQGFFRFYNREFDFETEVVSVSKGKRCTRTTSSQSHICIEDPCDAAHGAPSTITEQRFRHLKEELQRADQLCLGGAALPELFTMLKAFG